MSENVNTIQDVINTYKFDLEGYIKRTESMIINILKNIEDLKTIPTEMPENPLEVDSNLQNTKTFQISSNFRFTDILIEKCLESYLLSITGKPFQVSVSEINNESTIPQGAQKQFDTLEQTE